MSKKIQVEMWLGQDTFFTPIFSRWKGQNLAIHAPMIGGEPTRSDKWVITHLPTGRRAGLMYSLQRAIKLAKEWDELFVNIPENPREWIMRDDWLSVIDIAP
jgi:hypothetical protein